MRIVIVLPPFLFIKIFFLKKILDSDEKGWIIQRVVKNENIPCIGNNYLVVPAAGLIFIIIAPTIANNKIRDVIRSHKK